MRFFLNFLLAVPAALAAPVFLEPRAGAETIANSWIVRVKSDSVLTDVVSRVTALTGISPARQYSFGSFKGFAIHDLADAVSLLGSITSIQSIEPNTKVYANALVTQQNSPYGLARISHKDAGATSYVYDSSAGEGTFSYIIDTGIYIEHNDFGGRAQYGVNLAEGEPDGDGNGHGTHVAGTTGSTTYGVAKKTTLIAVKVLGADGSGTNDQVLAGIDWAVNDAKSKGRIGKAVANLSLGGIFSPSTNAAAAEAVSQGLFLAVAAGNDGLPAFTSSPASEKSVCTIGASDASDNKASFSNFGSLVDVFAPGVNVTSAWIDGPDDTNTISGTSMATPHVTGLGAYLLALEGAKDPIALCDRIKALANKKVKNPGLFTTNGVAYNGNGA